MGVFRIIALFLLIYFGIKFLGRILSPIVGKANGRSGQGASRSGESNSRKEGDVTIEYTKNKQGSKNQNGHTEGDYVDFEELD